MSESLFDDIKFNVVVDDKEAVEHIEKCVEGVNNFLNNLGGNMYTKENLFNRAVNIYEQMNTLKEDLKALKSDFTYDEDMNPKGLEKEEVKEVVAFANKYVADGVEKVIETAETYKQLKEELIG